MQRLWLAPHRYELILERAFLHHPEQKIPFLDVPQLARTGRDAAARTHRAAAVPRRALGWRQRGAATEPVAHRPPHRAIDERLTAVFEHIAASPWLAEHTAIYIRHDLGIQLTKKPAQG
jgi:hypothetical protein